MTIRSGMVGSLAEGSEDPQKLIATCEAQSLLSAIAKNGFCSAAAARRRYGPVFEKLLSRRVVARRPSGRVELRWPLWRQTDSIVLQQAADRLIPDLISQLQRKRSEIYSLLESLACARLLGCERVALLVVGCFGLDWGAIYGLNSRGLLSLGDSFADGSRYLLNLYDENYRVDGGICSSRNSQIGRYLFTSFGANSGTRLCLPDLMPRSDGWTRPTDQVFGALEAEYRQLAEQMPQEPALVAGHLLEDLVRKGTCAAPNRLSRFLQRTGYLDEGGRPCVSIFLPEEAPVIARCVRVVVELAAEWVYNIRQDTELAQLSPLQAGMPWDICLMEIWHVMFGRLNRMLVDEGAFKLPPGKTSQKGCYTQAVTAGCERVQRTLMDEVILKD